MDLDKYGYGQDFANISQDNVYRFFFLDIQQYKVFFKHDIIGRVTYKELDKQFAKNQ